MGALRFKGVALELGGDTFVVPPLTLGAFEDHADALRSFDGQPSVANVRMVVDLLTRALQRNYPDITRDEVRERVDLQSMSAVMFALMGVSGATEAAAGNTGATATLGTGSPSMPASPPVSDGPSSTAAST
jgi:hypothetical protein